MRGQKYTLRIRKFLPIFAVVGILAVVGGVFAFYQDSALFNNQFGVASYEAEYIENFQSPTDWETCEEVPKTVITKNNSTGNFKVRLSYEEYWRNAADSANLPLVKDGETLALINFQNENDWTRHGNWYYYNYEVEPGESTNSLFKSVTLNCDANLAKYNVCRDTPTGKECTQPENEYEAATYHLNIKVQTTSGEFPHDEQYHVTLNPNGGTYEGSTDIYDAYLQYGTVIDLDSVTYPEHEIVDWTLNGTESYTESTITVTDDIDLFANWQTSIFHTVTVDPNGGSLDGETQPISTRVRKGDNFTLTDTEPTLADHLFTGWTVNGQPLTNYTFAVMNDVTITANWGPIIAQNTRTSKLYTSLTNAEAEAQSGDTIKLVDNDEEHFTNTKNITLDLNDFVVSGSVTNNGTMTLLNGEIRNEDGVAFTNNGTLTMGINDHIDENTANVDPDYVRLIGTTTGLDQNGDFYYYDGFIEGEFAFDGGYNGSPYYRNAFDGKTVYYFPLVDSCRDKESCQHVELESSDLAHSKTTVGGDIYYYNIQDNINMSMRTGYKIYIARGDNFATGYGITIPEGADITIDLNGNEMTMTDAITVNGKLTIEDNKTTVVTENVQDNSTALPNISGNVFVTPHDNNTTMTTTYAGIIHTPQTVINNGELVLRKARLEGTSGLDSIQSSGTLSMEAGAIGAASGYTIRPTDNAVYNLDNNSYIYSTATNKAAVYNTISNFVWDNDGIIYGNRYGIQSSSSDKKVLISSGTVFGKETGVLDSTVTVDGGTVGSHAKGIGSTGRVTIESGTVRVNSANGGAVGISRYTSSSIGSEVVTMNGGEIIVIGGSSSSAVGIESHVIQSGGTITVTNTGSGAAYGIYNSRSDGSSKGIIVNDGTISAQANSGSAFGIYTRNAYILRVVDGNISGTSTSGTGYGINGAGASESVVKGGTVYGSTYGIYNTNAATPTVLGTNGDEVSTSSPEIIGDSYALYNGAFYFYDGVLRGKTGAYGTGVITAIPDGYTYHTEETASYKENCWLVPAENYLHVVGGGDYNSLSKAYEAITGDTGTIEVTQDTAAESAHPSSPQGKTITFDLKGHTLNYTQPIINGGTMILEDSSQEKTGKLINANTAQPAITNNGNLTINSGDYSSKYRTVQNNGDSAFTLNGGILRSSNIGIYNNGSHNNSTGRYMDHPANVYINGGEVIVESSNSSIKYGVNNATQGQNFVNITGGKITVKNEQSGTSCDLYGILGGTITINAPAGQIALDVNNANGLARGIGGGLVTLESGTISVQSANKSVTGISRYTSSSIGSEVVTMNGGEIIATGGSSNSESIRGIESHVIQSGGTITATNNGSGTAYGIYDDRYDNESKGVIINNGAISAQANSGSAFGVSVTGNVPVFRMTDGSISGASTSGTGYGIYSAAYKEYIVKDGAIHGSTYGIYNVYASRPATLGVNGDAVSTSSPEIIGDSYALYNGAFYFYDGVLRGKTGAYSEGVVKQIADDTTIYIEHQTIGGDDYEVRYLIAEYDVAKIGDTKYKKLSSAIEAANTDDNIEILADIYAFDALTISAEKDITIDTKGFDFYISSSITNNGQVSIVNNSAKKTVLKYSSPDYAIINNASGTLSIEKMALDVYYGINNSGSLTLDDVSIDADNTAINNIGDITADGVDISGTEYSLYNDGGNSTFENSNFTGKYFYNNSGTLNLNNSTAERSDSSTANISDYVTNKGTLNLDSTTIARVGICSGTSSNHCRSLYNTGNLSMSNSSTVSNTTSNPSSYLYSKVSTIINDGGNITASDSSVLLSISDVSSGHYTAETQSIRNNSGSITIESGTVSASGPGRVYGIYNDTGNVTLGIAEPTTSPDYGKDTANVSKTNPAITAISTTNNSSYKIGIGIKNNTGKTYFYDGKITGTSTAMPEAPTETEYLYETRDYIDENTGNQYRILEWIRQQPSPGGE